MHLFSMIMNAIRLGVAVLRHLGGQVGERPQSDELTEEEVKKVLAAGLAASPDATNYDNSIVDLLKVLKIDSSLAHRKQMATEFGYGGPKDGSAEMNTWLHAEVMRRIAEYYPRPTNA